MGSKGVSSNGDVQVQRWPGRILCADDVRRHLNGTGELLVAPRTIITPLAADELRAQGIKVQRHQAEEAGAPQAHGGWAFAQEKPDALVASAIRALERDGLKPREITLQETLPCRWGKTLAQGLARREYDGLVVFCQDAGFICCLANKVAGVRAVAVHNAAQAKRALVKLAANFLAVEMPGRTFFEVRQIVRTVCQQGCCACPADLAQALEELESHAHR